MKTTMGEGNLNQSVFITGGSGSIGRHLLVELSKQDLMIRALVHRTPIEQKDIQIVEGDLLDFRPEWLDGIDAVIHLASLTDPGKSKNSMKKINTEGASHLVKILKSLDRPIRLLFVSSIVVCGPSQQGRALTSGTPANPITPFGKSMLAAERIVSRYPRITIVRFPMLTGQGMRSTLWFEKLAKLLGVFPVTASRFSALDVRDVSRVLVHLLFAQTSAGEVFIITDGRTYSWSDLADSFSRLVGRRLIHLRLPSWMLRRTIFRLLGHSDAALYFKFDWFCNPNYPEAFQPQYVAYS